MKSGVWVKDQLFMPSVSEPAALAAEVTKAVGTQRDSPSSVAVNVDGVPHLLFYKLL